MSELEGVTHVARRIKVKPAAVVVAETPVEVKPSLESLALEARIVLGGALRLMIAAHVEEIDPVRLRTENALEAVRSEVDRHLFNPATLDNAAAQAEAVITLLANNTFTRQDKLQEFRGEVSRFSKAVSAFNPPKVEPV